MGGRVEHSVSTWSRPVSRPISAPRAEVLDALAEHTQGLGRRRLRIAVDGRTAAGKTTLAHELADHLSHRGRIVLRASLDDFKRPWRDRHRYDRLSGEGYYRNAFDLDRIEKVLLGPASDNGTGDVALCGTDPLTQVDHADRRTPMPADGVLVVDGVFAFRPALVRHWDLRIWVHVDAATSLRRGIARDAGRLTADEAESLHRDRYQAAERVYIAEEAPALRADVVVDNTVPERPRLSRR